MYVALHEVGHALGLFHSPNDKAIMFPFYQAAESMYRLHTEDVLRIQKLYGPSNDYVLIPNDKNVKKTGICQNYTFDAVFSIHKDDVLHTYGFYGHHYIELLTNKSVLARPIIKDWKNVPNNMDCALTWHKKYSCSFDQNLKSATKQAIVLEKTVFIFRGLFYWKYSGNSMTLSEGYPRFIQNGWGNLPTPIDAAFEWKDGHTYFFRGQYIFFFLFWGGDAAMF